MSRRFAGYLTTNGDGWYIFPSVYILTGLYSYSDIRFVDFGFTFLRWSFVITWYRKPTGGQ